MPAGARPLRTITFNFRATADPVLMSDASKLASDALSFSLENARGSELTGSRANIRAFVEEIGERRPIFAHLRPTDSPLILDDLEAVVCPALYGIMLPHVGGPHDIIVFDRLLRLFEARAGMEPGQILILPMLETATGPRLAFEIATACDRIAHMGGVVSRRGDFGSSIGYEWTPEGRESIYLRQKVYLDARAAGVPFPVTGHFQPVDDAAGLERFAVESRQIGYSGMFCSPIPDYIDVINRVFTPAQDEIDDCARIVAEGTSALTSWARSRIDHAGHFGVVPTT